MPRTRPRRRLRRRPASECSRSVFAPFLALVCVSVSVCVCVCVIVIRIVYTVFVYTHTHTQTHTHTHTHVYLFACRRSSRWNPRAAGGLSVVAGTPVSSIVGLFCPYLRALLTLVDLFSFPTTHSRAHLTLSRSLFSPILGLI